MYRVKKILAIALAVIMTVTSISMSTQASADGAGTGKYVSDVYFAYGKTEAEAVQWLEGNGWEPIKGSNDFNAGKASLFDDDMAVAMGIKRTDKAEEAITDMAVMNMKGGYSFPDYETLLQEKRTEIDEFIAGFIPVLEEYRDNYNGQGSLFGMNRAALAHALLNNFYDGGSDDPYAKNDTGHPIGDILLEPLKQEGNESGGDLQQILLESSGSVVLLIEHALAFGADAGQDTWIERLETLSGDGLAEHLEEYVPEAAGQNVSPSSAMQYLNQKFGDTARILAEQWVDINEDMRWYEAYCTSNGLWAGDGESSEAYSARIKACFDALKKADSAAYDEAYDRFVSTQLLYTVLYTLSYEGEWGATLGDFFNPAGDQDYGDDPDNFLPFAAAMSPGQRASAENISFRSLLLIGSGDRESLDMATSVIESSFDLENPVSVYFGVNRGIFRGGVALTSEALMAQNMGAGNALDKMYGNAGYLSISSYAVAGLGAILLIAGIKLSSEIVGTVSAFPVTAIVQDINITKEGIEMALDSQKTIDAVTDAMDNDVYRTWKYNTEKGYYVNNKYPNATGGAVFMGIGGALMIGAAFVKGYQLYRYYQRDFTQIPLMIVDEADIVSYVKDENGNDVKQITFDQYAYYSAARCNRQEVGQISDWQSGVESYPVWGCGDVADLNGDFGQEWLALYTVRNTAKGNPILADSLTLQYGSKEMPKGCTRKLHFFTMTNAVDLGDMAYSYNNKKDGVYFFWDSDAAAAADATASAFSVGQMALAGAGGLVLGLLIATLVFLTKRKKKEVRSV